MKKVAIVTPYGAEPRFDNYAEFILAQNLIERGFETRMYTYRTGKTDTVYKGVPVTRCRYRHGISPRLFLSLLFFRPDVILCFHPKSHLNFSAYLAARILGAKFIVEIVGILHDPYIVRDVDDPIGNLIDPPQIITTVTQFLKNFWQKKSWENFVTHFPTKHANTIIAINRDEQRYVQHYYGRESECIYWCTPASIVVAQKPITPLPNTYLFFIGQVKKRKGWDTAIDALAALKARNIKKEMVFVAPLADIERPRAYAQQKGVLDIITFLTGISNEEKQWLYENCDCVLVPSTYEGFGIPIFEAFLAKKPVCATDIPVFREFLTHRENALLSSLGDGEALADSIQLLDSDPTLRNTLIEHGTRTAAKFDKSIMIDHYLRVIDVSR